MVNKEILNVQKRNGRGSVPLNIEKIHEMVEYACEDITGVSSSQVEMSSGLQFYDGMTTDEIQKILIKSCLLYTSPSPRDRQKSRMPSSA